MRCPADWRRCPAVSYTHLDDYRATLTQAEAEAGAAYDKSLAEVQKECSQMKSEAKSKLPKAVEIITGKVVKSSGNC